MQGAFLPLEGSQITDDVIRMLLIVVALDQSAVVGGEYDHGIVGQALLLNFSDDASDLIVDFLYHPGINGVWEGAFPFFRPLAVFLD